MPKISTRVTFDKAAAIARIKAANNTALTEMAFHAMKDINKHVPEDQGDLFNSGITNSDKGARDGKFSFRWSTPYAKYLWHGEVMHGTPPRSLADYGPDMIKFTKKLAHMEWAKYAKEVYGENWKTVYQAALRKELTK